MRVTPAAGGGRWVQVDPFRLVAWLDGFGARHGAVEVRPGPAVVVVEGRDGADAAVEVPFGPLVVDPDLPYGGLIAHVQRERRVGVILVRLGGHAVGIVVGDRLVASKVGSRQVHGRSAAGGQSQQRFARRREGQARLALTAAADTTAALLLPAVRALDAVVLGGDRRAVDGVLGDGRLTALRALVTGPLLDVPEPRLRVLAATPPLVRAVRIRVSDPPVGNADVTSSSGRPRRE